MSRTHDEALLKDAEAPVQKILTNALFTLAATRAQMGQVEEAENTGNEVLAHSPQVRSEIGWLWRVYVAVLTVLPEAETLLKKHGRRRDRSNQFAQLLRRARELANLSAHYFLTQRQVQISDRTCQHRVTSRL